MLISYLIFELLFLWNAGQLQALTCFNCRGISHPRFCDLVKECSDDQICGTEREVKSNGDVVFNTGCMSSNLCDSGSSSINGHQPCIDCCASDLCNTNGCGEQDITTTNGIICYECSGIVGQDTCHTVSFCEPFEVCYIEERTHFGETFFRSGCKVKHACDSQFSPIPIIGRRSMIERRSTTHVSCCDKTLCNDLSHIKPAYLSTSVTTTMQPATTATMTVTTTLPLSTTASKGYPTECADLASDRDGVYTIFPKGSVNEVMVYCMMRGNQKWTVIQRRMNGEVDFYKTWAEYKHGFGSVKGEYWLGNDNIHLITSNGDHELSVYVEDFSGSHSYANYTHFVVEDESNKYRLSISGYIGVAGDGLSDGNGHNFTTKDQDNDSYTDNCAVMRHAAWWFNSCDYANLNGLYNDTRGSGPYWYYWHTNTQPLKAAIMMIKRR